VRLIQESLTDVCDIGGLHAVEDGEQAMAFLRRQGKHADAPRPDLVILDLTCPENVAASVGGDESGPCASAHSGGYTEHL